MSPLLGVQPTTTRRAAMAQLARAFADAGIDDPAVDARLLLCKAASIDPIDLIRDPDLPLESAAESLRVLAQRRISREPVTRILGSRGFWSLDLAVHPGVLDPRPDTETIIDATLDLFGQEQERPLRIVDLGTGSGAIACALLDTFRNASCVAIDLSPKACAAALDNVRRHGFFDRTIIREGSWNAAAPGPYDLVVSNPPYIPSAELATLDPEVREHDPELALDGGADGLRAYREFVPLLHAILAPEGAVVLEVGIGQAAAVIAVLADAGFFIGRHEAGPRRH